MTLSPKNKLRVGVVQTTSADDVPQNLKQIFSQLKKFKGKKLNLVCLPENALFLRLTPGSFSGFGFDLSEGFWQEFIDWAKAERCEILVGSVPLKENGYVSNATLHVTSDDVKCVYRKIHLFDVDVKGAAPVRESDYFKHGERPQMLHLNGWNIGLTICYDLRFSKLFAKYAEQGAHLLLVPSAFLVPTGKAHWHVLLRARAIESQAYVVAAAQSGVHKSAKAKRETYGHSIAIEPWGQILHESKKRGPDAFIVELDPAKLLRTREQIPMADHRRL